MYVEDLAPLQAPTTHNVIPERVMKTLDEASICFQQQAKESGLENAYNLFNVRQNRESLSIPTAIWKELEPVIRDQINAIRTRLREA